jgi:hypothetical protein
MNRQNGRMAKVDRDDVLDALRDRAWHSQAEIAELFVSRIAPEDATEKFRKMFKGRINASLETQIETGAYQIIAAICHSLRQSGLIEREGQKGPLGRCRLTAWWCWACGDRFGGWPDERPDHGLCDRCKAALQPEAMEVS